MAEQRFVNNTGSIGNNVSRGAGASGGTQLAERPMQVQGVSEAARSGRSTEESKAIPFAAVSFVSGLVGLLVANLLLGPLAIVLGLIGLRADSGRRVRASLGILLGVADIAVFVLLAAHSGAHDGSLHWSFFSR